ncbi:MAG: DUF1461 domain-containing protein [Eubacteriales bacterium]|nr:DUF1461 domain-containing protein [Eubacteriales bacterium]
MRRKVGFALTTLGWIAVFIVLLMSAVYSVGRDDALYYKLQMREDILDEAGISEDTLATLDWRLATYLFAPGEAEKTFYNLEVEVFGEEQPAFTEKELTHLQDCRKLLWITVNAWNYVLLVAVGAALIFAGWWLDAEIARAAWLASALILLPIAIFGVWAAIDFNSAFNLSHRLLFTNDLWLLNPETDLLIRICPSSMFAGIGLRIGLRAAISILGIAGAVEARISNARKRETNETVEP